MLAERRERERRERERENTRRRFERATAFVGHPIAYLTIA
jgi:hypothetical protein